MQTVPQIAHVPVQRAAVAVRPAQPEDDLEALNVGNPLGWVVEYWQSVAAAAPDFPFVRLVGLLDGLPVGFVLATPTPVAAGGHGAAMLHVLPHARRRGVGSALRAAMSDAVRGACPGLSYSYADDDAEGAAAAAAWGLPEVARHHESVLDLTALDADVFHQPDPPGIVLEPLPDDLDESGWRALHAYVQDRFREAPDAADGGGEFPYDPFRAAVPEPWMVLVARRDGQPVGVTCVMRRPGTADGVNTLFTGVSRDARGRGLAVALKARHAVLLAQRGLVRLSTQNMVGNEPILAANARLGFVRASGYVDVVDVLTG